MRHTSYPTVRAMTLIEVTLVIAVLLGLISVTLFGAKAYKQGANRAICLQNISNAQKAVRSFSNLNELVSGAECPGLRSEIYGTDRFLPVEPKCPSNGEYTYLEDEIPEIGQLYLACSVQSHAPAGNAVW